MPTQRLPFLPRERAMLPLRTAPAEAFVKTALLEIGARSQLPSAAFRPLSGSGRGGAGPSPNPTPTPITLPLPLFRWGRGATPALPFHPSPYPYPYA